MFACVASGEVLASWRSDWSREACGLPICRCDVCWGPIGSVVPCLVPNWRYLVYSHRNNTCVKCCAFREYQREKVKRAETEGALVLPETTLAGHYTTSRAINISLLRTPRYNLYFKFVPSKLLVYDCHLWADCLDGVGSLTCKTCLSTYSGLSETGKTVCLKTDLRSFIHLELSLLNIYVSSTGYMEEGIICFILGFL